MSIPLNIDWQQILLHLFNFAILSGGLYLLLYRPVKAFMDQRQAYYQNLHQEVEADMARRRADAEKELDALRAQQVAAAKQEAEEIISKAQESARREKAEVLSKASKELVDMAVTAAEKIALGSEGDPYEQFLSLAEGRDSCEQQFQRAYGRPSGRHAAQ